MKIFNFLIVLYFEIHSPIKHHSYSIFSEYVNFNFKVTDKKSFLSQKECYYFDHRKILE